jgi:quinol monooxygenase YgiN
MSVTMARAKVKADKTAELEKASREMFAAIEAAQPQGVHYASWRLPDGETYVVLLELDDDEDNPLFAIPAFREVQDNLKNWIAGPPVVEQLTPVGSYRRFLSSLPAGCGPHAGSTPKAHRTGMRA